MKKLLFLLLASFLVLAACGQEESKTEDKKETKASDKESKKDDDKKSDEEKDKSHDKSNEEVANEEPQSQEQQSTEEPMQSQEQVNTQEEQPVQSQEQAPVAEEQTSQGANNEESNLPAGDAMFGEYKDDGTYCTVGGCLSPEQQKEQEEANYEEMENQGYSREEYDEIQNKGAELQQQRNNGEISSEEFTDRYLELYD
ncbi:hypothetical protein M4L38_01190 [Staphylococcus equorum]|uniref:hypothetical protein n=1 Tax=Staphylococcus equorum TaxID=246432 RepID=UPI0024079296|nr:hypothetical protein [Staphylococcus equorum]MDG0821380.1 hypothetical protein [Staphylococcus equorum]